MSIILWLLALMFIQVFATLHEQFSETKMSHLKYSDKYWLLRGGLCQHYSSLLNQHLKSPTYMWQFSRLYYYLISELHNGYSSSKWKQNQWQRTPWYTRMSLSIVDDFKVFFIHVLTEKLHRLSEGCPTLTANPTQAVV